LAAPTHRSRRAFVVTSDVAFGLARMFDILTKERGHEIHVFTTMPEARQWLGMPSQARSATAVTPFLRAQCAQQ
jgi:hypothetical protein